MRKLLIGIAAVALVVGLSVAPALAEPVEYATASCDVTLTIERFLSIEVTKPPHIVISGGESWGQNYVGFNVKYNFFPCYYQYWCELADGMPAHWNLYAANYKWEEGGVRYNQNTFTDLTGMHYFPDGMGLGSTGAKLEGVKLEDNADDYTNTVIGTLTFEFQDGTSPSGD